MNQKSLLILGAVTVAAIGAAVMNRPGSGTAQGSDSERGPLFPDLQSHVNDVAEIKVRQGEDELTVQLEGAEWVLSDRGGYPAKFEKAKETVLQLAELKIDEVKTANPAYFGKLGVEEPGPELPGRSITLSDAAGKTMAAVVVGNTPPRAREAAFVRREGEDQVYQTKGRVEATPRLTDWADRDLLKIAKDRVAEVSIKHPDGDEVKIALDAAGKSTLLDLPADRELSYATVGDSIMGALASLQFDDVNQADAVTLPAGEETTATFRCKGGLVLTVSIWNLEDTFWTKLQASFDESRVEVPEPDAPTPEQVASDSEEGADQADAATSEEAAAKAEMERASKREALVNAGRAEAEELQAKFEPWVYALPSYRAGNLTKHTEDLLKPLPDPNAEAPSTGGPGVPGEPGTQLSPEELQKLLREAGVDPATMQSASGSTNDG